jgi:hypothetical protein
MEMERVNRRTRAVMKLEPRAGRRADRLLLNIFTPNVFASLPKTAFRKNRNREIRQTDTNKS